MPILKSAVKKLRRDKKKEKENDSLRELMEKAVKSAKKIKTQKAVSEAFSILDKSVKKNLIRKNKASRIKSSLSKILPQKAISAQKPKKVTKKQTSSTKTTKKTV